MGQSLTGEAGPLILDGVALARARSAELAIRAGLVAARRGFPPRLALIAFADEGGGAPHAARKERAAAAVGVEVKSLVLPFGVTTAAAAGAIVALLEEEPCDGVFIEFPFPAGVDEAALVGLIREEADLDIMTESRIDRYLTGLDSDPPLTIAAGLELLAAYGVDIRGLDGVVVGELLPFTEIFREELGRRGAAMRPIVPPDTADLDFALSGAELIIVTAARPGLVRSGSLERGAVVIDAGYFNPTGHGDIDLAGGIEHLAALSPVPGGIGPMTISVLFERLIEFVERVAGESAAGR
jgi:methylenetetrahydrofolate dehydrogenase (NADP+)/methenyltetrahydrofolate cyclohydrolase